MHLPPLPAVARRLAWLPALLSALALGPVWAQHGAHAHSHGLVRLDVALDAGSVSLQLDAPLDSLLGFERAPRTDAERRAVEALRAQLAQPDKLFGLDAAAGCSGQLPQLVSPVLDAAAAAAAAKPDDHADLQAAYLFRCRQPGVLKVIDLSGLLAAFNRIQRIEVQAVTPAGQHKQLLKRPQAMVRLGR